MVFVTLVVAWMVALQAPWKGENLSTIVQLDRVVELRPATHGDVQVMLRSGVSLVLSRTWRDRVERLCPIIPRGAPRLD